MPGEDEAQEEEAAGRGGSGGGGGGGDDSLSSCMPLVLPLPAPRCNSLPLHLSPPPVLHLPRLSLPPFIALRLLAPQTNERRYQPPSSVIWADHYLGITYLTDAASTN